MMTTGGLIINPMAAIAVNRMFMALDNSTTGRIR